MATSKQTAEQMTQSLKKLILGSGSAAASRCQATADGLVAASLLNASPNPTACPRQLTEFMWDEELPDSHWPIDDETVFYNQCGGSNSSRQDTSPGRNFFDLNISLPVYVPQTTVHILNSEGENYYHSSRDLSTNVLFGRYEEASCEADHSADNENSGVDGASTFPVLTDGIPADEKPPISVCDVWASFLRIQVGSIRNCRANQIQEITEMFLNALKDVNFTKAVEIQCAGVYSGQKNRLETRAKFIDADDLAQFRIIRRALKIFVLRLRERFCVAQGRNASPDFIACLSPACKTGAYLPIELRRYSSSSKEVQALAKSGKGVYEYENSKGEKVEIPLQVKCLLQEIRLEMTHARAVDPRWTDSWVLCRRMPMNAMITPGRKVFCPLTAIPPVVYHFQNPKSKLTKSRFGALYMITESALNLNKKKQDESNNKEGGKQHSLEHVIHPTLVDSQMRAEATPFFPIQALSQVLQNLEQRRQAPNAWEKLVESALTREQNVGMDILNALRNGGGGENSHPSSFRRF